MASVNITSTQFADACSIPRPTLSQILSGRNKKISDEVIAKIHDAYPRLSVMWLLFGEGEMISTTNIKISVPQNAPKYPYESESPTASGGVFGEENNDSESLFPEHQTDGETLYFGDDVSEVAPVAEVKNDTPPTVSIPADGSKSIVNIMVFYSDNSYQSFVPR